MEEYEKLSGKYIIFSDVQGSYDYLDRFFKSTKKMKKQGYICLGDIIDKTKEFSDNQCIQAVREKVDFCVRGNHEDKATPDSVKKIFPQNLDYIKNLPKFLSLGHTLLFHSSIKEPGLRLYHQKQISDEAKYIQQVYPNVKFALFGHTHLKGAYSHDGNSILKKETEEIKLDSNKLNIINPGGIGLRHRLEKTFARINFDEPSIRFFTLEEAEEMSYKADIVNCFDDRWMPSLNPASYPWFVAYAKRDVPALTSLGKKDYLINNLVETLSSFNPLYFEKSKEGKRNRYIREYSLRLANDIENMRQKIDDYYNTKDPKKSRDEYLRLEGLF